MSERPNEHSRIASTAELASGLALIFVAGPDFRAKEGLDLIRSHLPASRPVLWHRLDRNGPNMVSAVRASELQEPILLVHGLEYLGEEERATAEASMNMMRDQLVFLRATLILWIPESDMESFQRHCADLFAWRSLLVMLSEDQVKVAPEVEARRSYLARLGIELRKQSRSNLRLAPMMLEALSERPVYPERDQGSVPLQRWAWETQYGILIGGAGSGKTTALFALALRWATEAIENTDAPCPMPVSALGLYLGVYFGLDLGGERLPRSDIFGTRVPQATTDWAKSGDLALLIDHWDEIEPLDPRPFVEWLEQLRELYPRVRVIAAASSGLEDFGPHWKRAWLTVPSAPPGPGAS